jgi:hypothetical protein
MVRTTDNDGVGRLLAHPDHCLARLVAPELAGRLVAPYLGLDAEPHALRLFELVLLAVDGPDKGVVTVVCTAIQVRSMQPQDSAEADAQFSVREETGARHPYVVEKVNVHCTV